MASSGFDKQRPCLGEGQRRVRNVVGRLVEGLDADVAYVVAGPMVAGVVRLAGGAAVDLRLFLRLLLLEPSVEPPGGDTNCHERDVIRAAVKGIGFRRQALGSEVVLEDLLDLRRARRTHGRGIGAITVVEEADVVWGTEHLEVYLQTDVGQLVVGEVPDVVPGAPKIELLGAPESKA
jgi:hypothetical protein